MEKYLSGVADSTLGDRAKAVNTYREFVVSWLIILRSVDKSNKSYGIIVLLCVFIYVVVFLDVFFGFFETKVYNKDQVYPEYLVLYERLHGERPPEPPPKDMPFLLELPLYWKNVGKNPRIQDSLDILGSLLKVSELPNERDSTIRSLKDSKSKLSFLH